MNSVERVKRILKERGIPVSRLEKDLGFANGYISQLRRGSFQSDRLEKIANYLNVSIDYLLHGGENENAALLEEDGDVMEIRDAIRDNPALRALFEASVGVPASRLYEAAALLAKYKEEQN